MISRLSVHDHIVIYLYSISAFLLNTLDRFCFNLKNVHTNGHDRKRYSLDEYQMSDLGKRIGYLRLLHGDKSKKDLCKEIGISRQTLKNIEEGVSPDFDTLIKIADYFNVSVDYLLRRTERASLVYKPIDALKISESARYVLEDNEVFGRLISLLLENGDFRKLIRQIDLYFNDDGLEAYNINNTLVNKAKDIIDKEQSSTPDLDEKITDALDDIFLDYDQDKLDKFAKEFANILPAVKLEYRLDSKDSEKMKRLALAVYDVCEDLTSKKEMLKRLSAETLVHSYMQQLKKKHALCKSEKAYDYFEKAFLEVIKDAE